MKAAILIVLVILIVCVQDLTTSIRESFPPKADAVAEIIPTPDQVAAAAEQAEREAYVAAIAVKSWSELATFEDRLHWIMARISKFGWLIIFFSIATIVIFGAYSKMANVR